MAECIRCHVVITGGEPYHEYTNEEYGDHWYWCSSTCLASDKNMTDCTECGAPLVVEDAMMSEWYVLRGPDYLREEPVLFCSIDCKHRFEDRGL